MRAIGVAIRGPNMRTVTIGLGTDPGSVRIDSSRASSLTPFRLYFRLQKVTERSGRLQLGRSSLCHWIEGTDRVVVTSGQAGS